MKARLIHGRYQVNQAISPLPENRVANRAKASRFSRLVKLTAGQILEPPCFPVVVGHREEGTLLAFELFRRAISGVKVVRRDKQPAAGEAQQARPLIAPTPGERRLSGRKRSRAVARCG